MTHPSRSSTDIHQHLWPAPLIEALRHRASPPRLRGWTLELDRAPARELRPVDHDPDERAAQALADGLSRALLCLTGPLGIELLDPAEAWALLDAYHDGAHVLPAPFGAWAATCLAALDQVDLAFQLDRGFVGLALPATALWSELSYRRVGPLLTLLEDRGRPLFVHPGPTSSAPCETAWWWPAIVSEVQQMHAAWFAWRAFGRPRHPRLRVCFAMLAGLAPLHVERCRTCAGARGAVDPDVFLDVSSYGPQAVDATIRALGVDVLVNGSDRPECDPCSLAGLGGAVHAALHEVNPVRLLDQRKEVRDAVAVTTRAQSRGR